MFDTLITQARDTARHTAQTAAIGIGASIALAVGLGFWTAAGWMLLITLTTPLNAAVIIGALYTGAALIGFAIASTRRGTGSKPDTSHEPTKAAPPTLESFVTAFMTGVTAGARTRS